MGFLGHDMDHCLSTFGCEHSTILSMNAWVYVMYIMNYGYFPTWVMLENIPNLTLLGIFEHPHFEKYPYGNNMLFTYFKGMFTDSVNGLLLH